MSKRKKTSYGFSSKNQSYSFKQQNELYYKKGEDISFRMTTEEEERNLFRTMRDETAPASERKQARDFLIRNHLLFAANFARRLDRKSSSDNDVVSAANSAIMKSIDKFNPEKGNRYTVYLRPYIQGEISDLWASKWPVNYRGHYPKASETSADRKPIDEPCLDHETEEKDHEDFIKKVLNRVGQSLKPDARKLIHAVYFEGKSCAEIARESVPEVCRAAIHSRLKKALTKLKTLLKAEKIEGL